MAVDGWLAADAVPCSRCRAASSLDTIGGYAATGVDLISVGRITNSAPVLDIGLDRSAR